MHPFADKRSRPLLLFYVLVTYVLLQFGWWTYLMFKQNQQIIELRLQVTELQYSNDPDLDERKKELENELRKKWMMAAGEGSIFLLLLVLGFFMIRKGFKKEAELARMQKNFLLSVTHELRSPMSSARLQMETLQKHQLDEEKKNKILSNTIHDLDRLNKMIENLLFSTRMDDKGWTLIKENINATEVLKKTIVRIMFNNNSRKINVITPNDTPLVADIHAFEMICSNLVENAIKYSPVDTEITVSLEQHGDRIRLTVADKGPGVPDSEKENVFKRFYRLGNEETRKAQGTGIGLFIVKSLVDRHGGSIEVLDNGGGGAIFCVKL